MKKILSILILFLVILSCAKKENEMILSGNIKGLKKGTLLLQKIKDSTLITIDSIVVNGDSGYIFSETINEPELYYLQVKVDNGIIRDDRIAFFAEANEMTLHTNLDNFEVDAKITGSLNQEKLDEYQKILDRYSNQSLELIEKSFNAQRDGNDSIVASIEKSQQSIIAKKYLATISFALANTDYEVAPYLMVNAVSNARLKYLDSVYNTLSPKIKDSKYGKDLESLIQSRKENEN